MSVSLAEWRAKKAQEEVDLHDRLRRAVQTGEVGIYTDQRMLDFQGSPVHNAWDHLLPLMVLMILALAVLLATGVAFGIVAMTVGAFVHLLGIKHFIAWRIRKRTADYVLQGNAHLNQVWALGGIALWIPRGGEPPCHAPKADWKKFVQRNLSETVRVSPADDDDSAPASTP